MKKVSEILLFAVFLVACNAGYSQTIAPPYQVGNWQGFRTAAISYTFDDGCSNQFAIAIPMFNEFDYDLTMFTVTGWGPNWTALQNAAAAGHEVANHTITHPHLGGMSLANQTTELVNSQNDINSHITGRKCVTLAYPFCEPSDQTLTAQYYIAARGCSGSIEPNTPGDFMNISSLACGDLGLVKTAADFNAKFVSTAASKGWCVFLIHGIDNDGGYSPLLSSVLRSSLEYLNAHRDTFWVSTFGNVARYAKERKDVTVAESSNTGDRITLQVTDTLDNALYNYPLTIRRPLPAGWSSAHVSQNGHAVDVCSVDANIMFDVVPDGGDVIISKGPYGNLTGSETVELEDLSAFFDLWLVNDCIETAGLDLDSDCLVKFYEFAFLAQNWLNAS